MKDFVVSVDFTMSRMIHIEAENEEQAQAIVEEKIKVNPYDYANSFDAYVSHEVTMKSDITCIMCQFTLCRLLYNPIKLQL